jgi:2-polyprenyl-3-methyl-5-hydroxy-6-metoxy-1,4-benzoquinol methylase
MPKGNSRTIVVELQEESKRWWSRTPMSYDWHGTNPAPEGSLEFFQEIDRRFFNASPLYRGGQPFSDLIPFESLSGKRVLEIGCGLGSHAQLLASSGCKLSAIDITSRAVDLTRRRLELHQYQAQVTEMDAEQLNFPDGEFDMVWSWGVIHHSAHTDRIVREVARVLKPGGEFRFMVYNRRAFDSYVKLIRGVLSGKLARGMSTSEILSFYTDGFIARYYTKASVASLVNENRLVVKKVSVLGQTSELLPLPGKGLLGRVKYSLLRRLPEGLVARLLQSTGSFLFTIATKPNVKPQ